MDEIQMSAINPLILVGLLKSQGFSDAAIFSGIKCDMPALQGSDKQVSLATYYALVRRAIDLTENPAIGLQLGQRINLTGAGIVGLAALACNTLAECLHLFKRSTSVMNPAVSGEVSSEGDYLSIEILEAYPWGDCTQATIDTGFSILTSAVGVVDQAACSTIVYEFTYPASPNEAAYEQILSGTLRFESRRNRMLIPQELCERAMPFQNEDVVQQADQWLKEMLERLSNQRLASLLPIQELIKANMEASMESVAVALHVSPRTLNRRLSAMGTSYKDVVLGVKQAEAMDMLANPNHTIDSIAYELGYSNPSNFSKAFKVWTGHTPSSYRSTFLNSDKGA